MINRIKWTGNRVCSDTYMVNRFMVASCKTIQVYTNKVMSCRKHNITSPCSGESRDVAQGSRDNAVPRDRR